MTRTSDNLAIERRRRIEWIRLKYVLNDARLNDIWTSLPSTSKS